MRLELRQYRYIRESVLELLGALGLSPSVGVDYDETTLISPSFKVERKMSVLYMNLYSQKPLELGELQDVMLATSQILSRFFTETFVEGESHLFRTAADPTAAHAWARRNWVSLSDADLGNPESKASKAFEAWQKLKVASLEEGWRHYRNLRDAEIARAEVKDLIKKGPLKIEDWKKVNDLVLAEIARLENLS